MVERQENVSTDASRMSLDHQRTNFGLLLVGGDGCCY
jgi:hypothetical protein